MKTNNETQSAPLSDRDKLFCYFYDLPKRPETISKFHENWICLDHFIWDEREQSEIIEHIAKAYKTYTDNCFTNNLSEWINQNINIWEKPAEEILSESNPKHIITSLSSYARLRIQASGRFYRISERCLTTMSETLTAQNISEYFWSMAALGRTPREKTLAAIENRIDTIITNETNQNNDVFNDHYAAKTLWSCAVLDSLNEFGNPFCKRIGERLIHEIQNGILKKISYSSYGQAQIHDSMLWYKDNYIGYAPTKETQETPSSIFRTRNILAASIVRSSAAFLSGFKTRSSSF